MNDVETNDIETNNVETTAFSEQVEIALKQYANPEWLGIHSPLATSYFLSSYLGNIGSEATQRGQALQRLLVAATAEIGGKYAERYQTLLREYYFHNRPAAVVWDQIGLAKNAFHLSRKAALAALEAALIARMQPALRLEQPPFPPALVERDEVVINCRQRLAVPETVALVGAAGIGKTACAAQVVQPRERPLFWYTVRPTLNDQPASLVFALALFAHRHGHSTLWLALATNPQQPINEQTLSALRYVLAEMTPLPLICIDGLEVLQPATLAHHQSFVHCLDTLRGIVPILLVGQQIPLDSDHLFSLGTLSAAAVSQLLLAQLGTVAPPMRAEFYRLTQGNPRLIKLSLAALANGETPAELQKFLTTSAALDLLFSQTLLRLPEAERQLLMALSVFRSPVPTAQWHRAATATALANLQTLGFVQVDRQGALEVPLLYRDFLHNQMDVATTQRLHEQAALVRSQGGAYTAAAYHWVEAGEPVAALTLWRTYQEQEITQGQAATALALFQRVQRQTLPAAAHEQATLICAQLEQFTGYINQAVTTLRALLGKTPILTVEGAELTGMIANDRSDFTTAADAFTRALQVAETLVEVRMARVYKGRAWLHLRQREIAQAERALSHAEFEVANMRGNLALDRCQYGQATGHYQAALQMAEALDLPEAIGKCTNNLAGVALFQGRFAEAIQHLTGAGAAYARIGKVAAEAGSRITLAVAHNLAGDHHTALALLQEAEDLLTARGRLQAWQQALLAQARAEAYLGLGEWAATERWVQEALAAEEINVLPDTYRVYGELCLQRHDPTEALRFLQQSLTLAEANEDRYLAAYAWRTLAQLYQSTGDLQQAASAKEAALALFDAMNLPHEVTRTVHLLAIG